MKKRFDLATVLVLMALMAVVTTVIVFLYLKEDYNRQLSDFSRQTKDLDALLQVKEDIEQKYVGEYDMNLIMQGAMAGMIDNLGDPWSHYLSPEDFAAYNDARKNSEISIGIDVKRNPDGTGMLVVKVHADSPAEKAGVLVDDVIVEIDGSPVDDMTLEMFSSALYGEEFSTVNLTVERGEDKERHTYEILRKTTPRQVVASKILGDVGYVRIENFNDNVDSDCIDAVNELIAAGAKGLIFDVRSNPGGSLDVMQRILDFLLDDGGPDSGTLIRLSAKDGNERTFTSDEACIRMPMGMAVLINGNSYSAAEFFAVCLKEYDWAVLVGEKTGGKGYAQQTFRLSDGSGLLLSTEAYYTPSGKSLAGVGILPDIEVELTEEERAQPVGENPEQDRQLQKALQHLGAIS